MVEDIGRVGVVDLDGPHRRLRPEVVDDPVLDRHGSIGGDDPGQGQPARVGRIDTDGQHRLGDPGSGGDVIAADRVLARSGLRLVAPRAVRLRERRIPPRLGFLTDAQVDDLDRDHGGVVHVALPVEQPGPAAGDRRVEVDEHHVAPGLEPCGLFVDPVLLHGPLDEALAAVS